MVEFIKPDGRILSKKEKEEDDALKWAGILILIGLFVGGVTAYLLTDGMGLAKSIRLSLVLFAAGGLGYLFYLFNELIGKIIGFTILIAILSGIGFVLYQWM